MNANDHTKNQFFHALKELQIAKLLHKSNITKSCGETFSDAPCGKSNLAFDRLTRPERVNVLILDTGIHASSCFSSRRYCGFYILRVPPEAVRFPVPVAQYVEVNRVGGGD